MHDPRQLGHAEAQDADELARQYREREGHTGTGFALAILGGALFWLAVIALTAWAFIFPVQAITAAAVAAAQADAITNPEQIEALK